MNPDSENFNTLRRSLKLKRYEQPPPGYFNRFSRDVMARIKAGEKGDEMGRLPWLQQVLAMFDVKPVYAGVFGTAVCALLVIGVISSETPTIPVASSSSGPEVGNYTVDVQSSAPAMAPVAFVTGNSNAVASSPPSLFDQFQPQVNVEPTRYWVPAGN